MVAKYEVIGSKRIRLPNRHVLIVMSVNFTGVTRLTIKYKIRGHPINIFTNVVDRNGCFLFSLDFYNDRGPYNRHIRSAKSGSISNSIHHKFFASFLINGYHVL